MNEVENGYIKLYRSFLNWEWHDNEYMLTVFIHCLMLANWKDKRWHGQVIQRGSFITSYVKLAEVCGIATNTCRKCCKKLQETGELTVTSNRQYTKITVINYDRYQSENQSDMHDDMQGDVQGVMQGVMQGDMHQMHNTVHNSVHTTEESKKVKNKEIKDIVLFLNKRTGKNYRPESNKTIRLINARINEGFKKEDFYTVIDKKCSEWMGTKMEQYLRPETLFGTKFESYLNQRQTVSLPFGDVVPSWYTSEPVRDAELVPATAEEIEATRQLLMKGVNHGKTD